MISLRNGLLAWVLAASSLGWAGQEVKLSEVPEVYRAVGTVRSRTEVQVSPRVVGRILEIPVRSGDAVKQGQLLVKIDTPESEVAAKLVLEKTKAADAAVAAAGDRIRQAQAALDLAKKEFDRHSKLRVQGAVSQQMLDQAEAAKRQAEAGLAQAIQAETAAKAEAAAAQQGLHQADIVYGFGTIVSPADGIVAERLAEPGDLASPGNILLKIFDPARLMCEVPVREGLVSRMKLGEKVEIEIGALKRQVSGEVKEIVPAIDPGSRTFLVKVCLEPTPGLMPGMFGTLDLQVGKRQAILLPESAIRREGQLERVRILQDGKPLDVLVRTVPAAAGQREVVSGLEAGMVLE